MESPKFMTISINFLLKFITMILDKFLNKKFKRSGYKAYRITKDDAKYPRQEDLTKILAESIREIGPVLKKLANE